MSRTSRQDEFLAAARKGQATMIEAIRTWVETVRELTQKLPPVHAPFADRFPSLPSIGLPSNRLPRPEEVVASGFDRAEKLLASQRKFAEEVLNATKPLIPGYGQPTPEDGGSATPQERTATPAEAPTATPAEAPTAVSARQASKTPSARQAPSARRAPKRPDAS
jgi:hypothetical protein